MDSIPLFTHEIEMARWWQKGTICGAPFITHDGSIANMLFQGRPGTGAGPDFCDAVMQLNNQILVGDIELHLHASGWTQHRHHINPRYESIALHVVQSAPATLNIQTFSGRTIPVLILNQRSFLRQYQQDAYAHIWPCQMRPQDGAATNEMLEYLGLQRFISKVRRWRQVFDHYPMPENAVHAILRDAMAEAAQYGRVFVPVSQPDAAEIERFDALTKARFATTLALMARSKNIVAHLCSIVLASGNPWREMLAYLADGGNDHQGLGYNRALIVAWNAVLPVLSAYGEFCHNRALAQRATDMAAHAPSLPSNAITRAMSHWLQLPSPPSGGIAQQGLHHVHRNWCKEKHCNNCPFGQNNTKRDAVLQDPPDLVLINFMDAQCAAQYVAV